MSRGRDQRRRQTKRSGGAAGMSTTIEGHLKVTIATMPGGNAFDMTGRDLQLSRAALLYADTIDIVSPGAQMLDSALAAGRGREGMREFMLEAGPGMLEGASEEQLRETQRVIAGVASQAFREAAAQLAPHSQEAAEVRLLEAQLDQMLDQASAMMEENLAGPRQERSLLQPAIDQGIVSIHRSGYLGLTGPDGVMERFVEHLDALLGDTSTQLLLDDDLAALVRARGTESSSFVERNAQEAFVGSGLISRLPTLQTLPVDELLDLRTGLDQQRRKYLRAVSALSQKMTTTAFAPERSDELEHLWRTDVSPALDDLRDQLADHSLVREMARRAGTDARTFAAASGAGGFGWLSLGVLQNADLLTALVAAAPAAGVAATSLAYALPHRHAGRREVTTRDLYYLVALDERSS